MIELFYLENFSLHILDYDSFYKDYIPDQPFGPLIA